MYKNNVPIYLQPTELLDQHVPHFVLLQLYYIYLKYKGANPVYAPPGQPGQVPQLVFRDHGRMPPPPARDIGSPEKARVSPNQSANSISGIGVNSSNQNNFTANSLVINSSGDQSGNHSGG